MKRITGTFLDEITHDIPSQNWSEAQWHQDFNAMKAIGIDTVILIRAGYKDVATFPSMVLRDKMNILPVYLDLVEVFLNEAERCEMDFFLGTYDSGKYWMEGNYQQEVELNQAFCDEVIERYGHRKAFKGWYISHEIHTYNAGMMTVYETLSKHLKALKDLPILISPYIKGFKQFGATAISLTEHITSWKQVFERIEGLVDIVAFQDGNVPLVILKDYLQANHALAQQCGLRTWSNVESFDRDMPIKFPPIDGRKLRYKMEEATKAGVEKLITFEFSHFMSPNSIYPAAKNLYQQYKTWFKA